MHIYTELLQLHNNLIINLIIVYNNLIVLMVYVQVYLLDNSFHKFLFCLFALKNARKSPICDFWLIKTLLKNNN